MNWEAVGAIGQLVAAVGVAPSLIYLAAQVRDQNKAQRRASLDLLSAQWDEIVKSANDSGDFGLIYLRGLQSFDELEPLSKLRFGAYLLRLFKYWDCMYFHHLDGTLQQSSWNALERIMADLLAYPGVQAWWRTRKHWFTAEIGTVIDRITAESCESNAYSGYY